MTQTEQTALLWQGFAQPRQPGFPGRQDDFVPRAGLASIKPDAERDLDELKRLLGRVEKTIHEQPDAVRYAMNGYVIALGICVLPLSDVAVRAAEKIGRVEVDMGNTACQVPYAPEYIEKARKRGVIGKKRKPAKC